MISVQGVSKSFGAVRAVRDVTLTLRPGEVAGLLGPNGAGKTTLIRMITGLLTPDSGSVTVCGHDSIVASAPARAALGYLPESAPSYPEMTVTQYLRYRAALFAPAPAGRDAAVQSAIASCWLDDMRHRRIGALSKGYRQRVGLAAAIVHDPKVLVLDEPTTGLDPSQIRAMRQLVRSLASGPSGRRVVLLSSHILPEVEQTCDRVLIIAAGKLRADGSPPELIARHSAAAPFRVTIAHGPTAGTFVRDLSAIPGVARVTPASHHDAEDTLDVYPHSPANDLRDPIFALAVRHAVHLRELSRQAATLEQVFVQVIEDAHTLPAPAATGRAA